MTTWYERRMRSRGGYHIGRRQLLLAALAGCAPRGRQPESVARVPSLPLGAQIGDVTSRTAVIWGAGDAAGRLKVTVNGKTFEGSVANADNDFTAKTLVTGLAPGSTVKYAAYFDKRTQVVEGTFRTAPEQPAMVRFAFSGDTNGQGWGIDPKRGGMPAYRALREWKPDLFIHLGDTIYADNPIPPSIALPNGKTWDNITTEGKSHVAKTLADFRAAHAYPRLAEEFRYCSANVPIAAIWDDHEVYDNWFPGERLDTNELARFARRAFYEYQPTLRLADEPMYRVLNYGPLADVFMLDGRSFRSPNEVLPNVTPGPGALLGGAQAEWLVRQLGESRALWKIIACDMPIGLQIGEPGKLVPTFAPDGWGNENGAPREREVELARILSGIKARGVKNVVWLSADVHYSAVHRFDPARAIYKDFDPFYELVAGPMHATAFGRKQLDDTFGPEVEWASMGWDERGSPFDGKQWFGVIDIDPLKPYLRVRYVNAFGDEVHQHTIAVS